MDIYIRNLRYNQELLLSHETKPFILEEDGVDFGEAEGEFSTVDDIQGLPIMPLPAKPVTAVRSLFTTAPVICCWPMVTWKRCRQKV